MPLLFNCWTASRRCSSAGSGCSGMLGDLGAKSAFPRMPSAVKPTAFPAEILPVMPSAMARLMVLSNSWPRATGAALAEPVPEVSPPLQLQLIPTPPRLGLAFLAFVLQSLVDAKLPAFLVVTCPPMFAAQAPPAEGHVKVTVQDICAFAEVGVCTKENSAVMLIAGTDQRSKERISPPESKIGRVREVNVQFKPGRR